MAQSAFLAQWRFPFRFLLPALFACGASVLTATTISQSFSQQHFEDGAKVASGAFLTAHQNDPVTVNDTAPFDGNFNGSDIGGPNFNATWTYHYSPVAFPIASADLLFGILDADSAAPGNQLLTFTVNGISLFTQLNALLEAPAGANVNNGQNSTVNVYDVAFPATTLAALMNGTATVSLALQGPGLGVLDSTPFNGAALDFATLTINSVATPEPSTFPVMLIALACLASLALRRRWVR